MKSIIICGIAISALLWGGGPKPKKEPALPPPSSLDKYIQEATRNGAAAKPETVGSLWNSQTPIADLARDVRARNVDDLVTISVIENVSAVASGDLKSARQSSLQASVTQLAGVKSPTGALANLAGASGNTSITGAGSTSRSAVVTTTLSARVTHVLPNGYLVVEGTKEIQLSSEKQVVTVRGVARPADLANNTVLSVNLAQLEVRVNGKGVVGDAIRRPNFCTA
jgi:flagellar L-ring protein precursor FlgH